MFFESMQSISLLEWTSVTLGVAYIVLATKENVWCWPAAFFGTALSAVLFWDSSLLMESGLNVYYLLMAVYGWRQWTKGKGSDQASSEHLADEHQLRISSFSATQHLAAISSVLAVSAISGYLLASHTSAVLPYLDSFTTWAAVLTTWMVTRKILENWLYWIVINPLALALCWHRELYLYAGLYGLYTILAVVGYLKWREKYQAESR